MYILAPLISHTDLYRGTAAYQALEKEIHAIWPRNSILGMMMDSGEALGTNLFFLLPARIASAIAWHTRHGGG